MFFSHFFASFFDFDFEPIFLRFWKGLGRFLEPKMAPEIDFWSDFFDVFWHLHFVAFCAEFLLFL